MLEFCRPKSQVHATFQMMENISFINNNTNGYHTNISIYLTQEGAEKLEGVLKIRIIKTFGHLLKVYNDRLAQ